MARPKFAPKVQPTRSVTAEGTVVHSTRFIKTVLLIATLALASMATQLALHPLYGRSATTFSHSGIRLSACLLSMLLPLEYNALSERTMLLVLATWFGYAPYTIYAVGTWAARWKSSVIGSCVAEMSVLVPAVSSGAALVRNWSSHTLKFLPGALSLRTVMAIGLFYSLSVVEQWLWTHVPLGGHVYSSNIFATIAIALTICAAFLSPAVPLNPRSFKPVFPFALPVIALLVAFSLPPSISPRLPYTRGSASSHATLTPAPPATVRILARSYSVSGLILVGEHIEDAFRFLRADHSLLGGRWIANKVVPGSRDGLGDSIYTTFVLQEAIRLAKGERVNERALFIGVGAGIAAEAFISQRINTTIVEIDPAVYKYAREYFGLPEPNQIFLQDAREWLQNHSPSVGEGGYDYVVHDCFSGGGVPVHMYTLEFWNELRRTMKGDGVVAVNFAGKLASEPARAIFLTLQRSFGPCRAFHDHLTAEFDSAYEFYNIVFFCSAWSAAAPTFRTAIKADYLGSHLRRHVLGGLEQREIKPQQILGLTEDPDLLVNGDEKWILRDNANRLEEWQQPYAMEHWSIMREVLPDVFWETY